ncbi:MAG TPA: PaaI family thioesterase [Thermomicrobiales bacterium]|nr:PaaI family thioesterase [Thermomicrobiales bacterium]
MSRAPHDREPERFDSPIPLDVRSDHGCFGCGRLNPHGLRLQFVQTAPAEVRAEFVPRREHEGFAGVIHGGIVATLLDEAMAWAAFAADVWVVTARIEVRFRRPLTTGDPVRVIGRVGDARSRLVQAAGRVERAADGALLAEANGAFVRVPPEQAAAWRAQYLGDDATAVGR